MDRSYHPSFFIQEELDAREWTLRDLVSRMRRYESEEDWDVNMLAFEMYMTIPDVLLSEDMARDLGVAFGVSKEFFLNLHAAWRAS
jgi:plasmid maintenance system antidote protein VapI